jgi:predicted nucleic acid-binding protein
VILVVVSDTSPVCSLAHLNHLDFLGRLFGEVLVPPALAAELRVAARNWPGLDVAAIPLFKVQAPRDLRQVARLSADLDPGESEAIALALECRADVVLVDESEGRAAATKLGLEVVGTLGVLERAKRRGLIAGVLPLVDRLTNETSFFVSTQVREELRQRMGE